MSSFVFPVGILFPTGHKVSCLSKIGDFMNKYEKRIKELKDENLDLKIKIRGETLTFVVCFIAIFGLFWIERRRSK